MNDKRRSQRLTRLDSRKRSLTRKIARAVANECRSSGGGDIVDEVVVVEIESFAVLESICKLRLRLSTSTVGLTPLRSESKEPTRRATDSIVGHSLALFVHLSTTSPPTAALHTRRYLTAVFQPTAPLPHHAQPNKLHSHFAPRSHASRFKSISGRKCNLTPRNAPALSHWTCPTSACSSSPFLLKNLRAVLTIQSQCKRLEFNVTEGRC